MLGVGGRDWRDVLTGDDFEEVSGFKDVNRLIQGLRRAFVGDCGVQRWVDSTGDADMAAGDRYICHEKHNRNERISLGTAKAREIS